MPIYDFSSAEKKPPRTYSYESIEPESDERFPSKNRLRDTLFSAVAARLFFFLLFIADVAWTCTAALRLLIAFIGKLCTLGKSPTFNTMQTKAWISLRRALICAVALFLALFSPAFGIMIACTYFLMYDKAGIEEVVPTSLQSQFREFYKS